MPGLVACGRRWDVGSDDFVYPAACEILVRAAWVIALAVVYSVHRSSLACPNGELLEIYYIGMFAMLALHIFLDLAIAFVSMKGSIVDGRPRKRLPVFLYTKIPLFLTELAWTIMGTVWAFTQANGCEPHVVLTMKGAVIAGWIILFALMIGIFVVFDPVGRKSTNVVGSNGTTEDEEAISAAKRLWELRCKLICCCAGRDEHSTNAFSDIAEMISDFFKGLDIVPTDIASGLILLQGEQKKQPNRLRLVPMTLSTLNEPQPPAPQPSVAQLSHSIVEVEPHEEPSTTAEIEPSSTPELPYPRPHEWMNITLATHYMRFASASYGWPLFMYADISCGLCKLCGTCRCCNCVRTSSVIEDNCCGCNTSAIIQMTGIEETDIIYASFYNRVFEIPFFVALDHSHRAVVVSVRGTLSLRDALTDMTAESDPLEVEGVPQGSAHRGILRAARFIQNSLKNMLLLQTAFSRAPNYRLVVTGHSLGAGAAAILAILLRPEYPDILCFAYSPPGWLLSKDLSRFTEDFIMSVVVGKDIVPRLGFITMEQLKMNVLKVVRDSNKPKYRVLASGAWYTLCGWPEDGTRLDSTGPHNNLIEGTRRVSYTQEQTNLERTLDDAIMSSSRTRYTENPLFMPGHVLYVEENEPARSCFGTPRYEAAWARAEVFDEILVSPQMVSDHLPDIVLKALEQLMDRDCSPRFVVRQAASPVNV